MMEYGPKILSAPSNSRFQNHLKNAASALCARTLPKQRRRDAAVASTARHHTYPRSTPPKRAPLAFQMESVLCDRPGDPQPEYTQRDVTDAPTPSNGVIKPKRTLAREVANAWESRVGRAHEPAPAARVQSLFNDIELYPTKTQVFEMLVCARQCARRKSLTLTFGEFCVFAAELRRYSKQAKLTPTKPESPLWTADKEIRDKETVCKNLNGSEPSPPPCEVFLGGSCNPTTWRSDIAIPILKKMGITYFNPQVEDWSTELMEVEHRAKAAARALLFVLDSETRAVAASVEAAHLAAAPRDLLLVLRPYSRHQMIGRETISDHEYIELSRARATLQEVVERRGLPAFTDIPAALRCARAVLRGARTHPRQSLGHTILRLKRAFDAAGGRNSRLPRSKAVDTLKEVTRTSRETADKSLPSGDTVDFESFCAAVAELVADAETNRNGSSEEAIVADAGAGGHDVAERAADTPANNGRVMYNARLKAYGRKLGLFIPKNGGSNRSSPDSTPGGAGAGGESGGVFTPGTERRLERLPAMLGAPTHHVYLAGGFPSSGPRPEEYLRRAGLTYVVPRANDYTRMFSAPARRPAPLHPESPRTDKKPKHDDDGVQLREKTQEEAGDRLSASDFYTVTEDVTPQPFKGTYDEDLLLGSRCLVFSLSSESPCFAAMVLAAHYTGLRPANTVLLVRPLQPDNTQYSEAAIKDYNRGRHYLTDLARRSDVPVFDNVEDCMNHVVSRFSNTRSS